MKNNSNIRVIISGGGTGGHIFPAISIANALKRIDESIEILFVGAIGRMEMEKVPAAGYNIEGLPITGFQRKLSLKNIVLMFKLMASLSKARKIMRKFKPDAAVGVGGYASGPMLHVAAKKGIPCLIQEQNSFPGVTNKLLAQKVQKICVAYDGMENYFPKDKIIFTGNPVRQDLESITDKRSEGYNYFKLAGNKKVILVVGGSLGARTINEAIQGSLEKLVGNKIQVIWQTGKGYYETAKQAVKGEAAEYIKVYDFISRMDLAYSISDVVISRAGAITISELCMVKKAVILVPSPNVSEDHQTKNAMKLIESHAAMMITDKEASEKLVDASIELLGDDFRINTYKENIGKLGMKNSAHNIANEILALIKK